jgi:hydrogenase maturation factor HypF (carbamoyltransferase family)
LETNKRAELTGVIQGVGFRPFVYQLAHRYDLKGFVENSSTGVTLEVEGKKHAIEAFLKAKLKKRKVHWFHRIWQYVTIVCRRWEI